MAAVARSVGTQSAGLGQQDKNLKLKFLLLATQMLKQTQSSVGEKLKLGP